MLEMLKTASYRLLALGMMLAAVHLQAADHLQCNGDVTTIKTQLQRIQQELQAVNTKRDYEESVKQRFDVVDKLLILSGECMKTDSGNEGSAKRWYQLKMMLASLQASAQVSAFTKFDDWVTAKELDLSAFENANMEKW